METELQGWWGKAIRFTIQALREQIAIKNENPKFFIWAAKADDIFEKLNPALSPE
ncbi:MAG: hypothetical protein WC765_01620 [Phycisphaerae bacterium]|jgi:hypothetical protein